MATTFEVKIENVAMAKSNIASGVFATPVGDSSPGPATPGKAYEFEFSAPVGAKLSFATMKVSTSPRRELLSWASEGTAT